MKTNTRRTLAAMLPCWIAGLALALVCTRLVPLLENTITARLQGHGGMSFARLSAFLAALFLTSLLASAGHSLLGFLQERVSSRWVDERVRGIVSRVLLARAGFLAERNSVEIVTRVTRDAEEESQFRMSCWVSVPTIALEMALALGMMFLGSSALWERFGFRHQPGDWRLALLVVALAPLHLLSLAFSRRLMSANQRFAEAGERERATLTETLEGVQDLRSSGAFPFGLDRVSSVLSESRLTRLRFWKVVLFLENLGPAFASFTHIALLGFSAWLILSRKTFTYPDYMGFASLCGAFNAAVSKVANLVREGMEAAPAGRRLREFDSLPHAFGPETGCTAAGAAPGSLEFRGVTFAATDGTEILRGVDLVLRPGEHVALVGPSGCGKTTLLKTAMRHVDPQAGFVSFSGTPLMEWNHPAYARHVAYVSQRPFLFHGTIRENILLGRDIAMDDAQLVKLADDVGLLDDLRRKGDNPLEALGTPVGQEGRTLSGGQTAKIALARALAGNPDVLLLDEVTASLDELSQDRIMRLLAGKFRSRTVLSVCHRLPAVRGMDRIVVMDCGRIVQDGTWDELANRPGLFADLVARETGGGIRSAVQPKGGESRAGEPSIVRSLSLSPVFADLDSEQLARLAATAESASTPAGAFLFRKGDDGDTLCVVESGKIEINGREYGPGYAFGEIALFGGLRRTADVRAAEESTFILLHRDDVLAACRNAPEIAIRLLAALSRIAARA